MSLTHGWKELWIAFWNFFIKLLVYTNIGSDKLRESQMRVHYRIGKADKKQEEERKNGYAFLGRDV
jgi:hypothetical protein